MIARRTIISVFAGPIFAIFDFHRMKVFWVQMIDLDLFSDISRDVAMATNFVEKWQTPLVRRSGISKRNGQSLPQCAH